MTILILFPLSLFSNILFVLSSLSSYTKKENRYGMFRITSFILCLKLLLFLFCAAVLTGNALGLIIYVGYHGSACRSRNSSIKAKQSSLSRCSCPCLNARCLNRRTGISSLIYATASILAVQDSGAANLPKSNGANLSMTGTVKTLIPIIDIQNRLKAAADVLLISASNSLEYRLSQEEIQTIENLLQKVPIRNESQFKKIFDAYSTPVSYKQKFMDNNAFLVYYSKGFDGPGRPSMESDSVPMQIIQYGFRNDAWAWVDEFTNEFDFVQKGGEDELKDLLEPLQKSVKAIDSYVNLAPDDDVQLARQMLDE